jgi:hypothetical protein
LKNLKEYLEDWVDVDVASFYLGCVLGIFDDDRIENFRIHKGTFWSRNPLGDFLYNTLYKMYDEGIVEMSNDGLAVRWIRS